MKRRSTRGNIPQQFLRYMLQRDGRYQLFTLYGLSFKASSDDGGTIRPLNENEVVLFEEIMRTLKFAGWERTNPNLYTGLSMEPAERHKTTCGSPRPSVYSTGRRHLESWLTPLDFLHENP